MSNHTEPEIKLLKEAFDSGNAALFAGLLEAHPELKAKINEPAAAFDAPVITGVRSREMLNVLLEAGADINAKSRWWAGGFGLLHNAPPDLAMYAIERGAVVDVHAAARLGLMERLRQLISSIPTLVHERGGDGQTPLHFASTVEIAEYLLDHGAEIDALDVDHESTPAQYMVRDRQNVARCLIRRGCRTDILMTAAMGEIELARQHLDADPACIHVSVSERFFPKKNPRSGGTIYIWTLGQYKTAHAIAREFGHEDILLMLMERSPEDVRLLRACEIGDEPTVKALLASRPDLIPRLPDEERGNLVNAAQNNNTKAVRLMLSVGWPIDVRGQHGGTALHWAAFHGNADMANLILHYNPPLEWIDTDFHATPLGWAIHGSEHGWYCRTGNYSATVEALLKAGAKPPGKLEGSEPVKEAVGRFLTEGRL